MKKNLLFVLISLLPSFLFAGNDNFATGARQEGMGNAGVTLTDLWSVNHNQAGLANLKEPCAGISYDARYLVPELSEKSVAAAVPIKKLGVFGLSMNYYGYKLYNEQKIGFAYAKSFGKSLSFGLQMDYLSTRIGEDYGHRNAFTAEAGVQAKITNSLDFGAHIFNPSRTKLSDYNDERTPTIMKLGFGYHFSDKIELCAETEKDVDAKNVFKAGLEYTIAKALILRAGVSSNPSLICFGFGLRLKNFRLDMASSMHPVLGYSPQLTLAYIIK